MNTEWHRRHTLPKNATATERLSWHEEHARVCGCRPPPASILAELKKRRGRSGLTK